MERIFESMWSLTDEFFVRHLSAWIFHAVRTPKLEKRNVETRVCEEKIAVFGVKFVRSRCMLRENEIFVLESQVQAGYECLSAGSLYTSHC